MVDGTDGKGGLRRTSEGVLLLVTSYMPSRYLNAAPVNVAACLWHLLLKVGYFARPAKKLEKADCWWRRACCSGTLETSLSHTNHVFFSVRLIVRWLVYSRFFLAARNRHRCATARLNCRRIAHTRTFEAKAQPDQELNKICIYRRVSWLTKYALKCKPC